MKLDLTRPFKKVKEPFQDDWCKNCRRVMNHPHRRLFAIPGMTVGNYESHTDADYYRGALWPVERREDIPAGMYACRAEEYHCPQCGRRRVKMMIYLPVRDKIKLEETILFDNGKYMSFLWD